jgi:hypothetical protein
VFAVRIGGRVFANAILTETRFNFLGVGIDPPAKVRLSFSPVNQLIYRSKSSKKYF